MLSVGRERTMTPLQRRTGVLVWGGEHLSAEPMVVSIAGFAAVQDAADAYPIGDHRGPQPRSHRQSNCSPGSRLRHRLGLRHRGRTLTKVNDRRFRLVSGPAIGGAEHRDPGGPVPLPAPGLSKLPTPESHDGGLVQLPGRRT